MFWMFCQLQESFLLYWTFTSHIDTSIEVTSPKPDMVFRYEATVALYNTVEQHVPIYITGDIILFSWTYHYVYHNAVSDVV